MLKSHPSNFYNDSWGSGIDHFVIILSNHPSFIFHLLSYIHCIYVFVIQNWWETCRHITHTVRFFSLRERRRAVDPHRFTLLHHGVTERLSDPTPSLLVLISIHFDNHVSNPAPAACVILKISGDSLTDRSPHHVSSWPWHKIIVSATLDNFLNFSIVRRWWRHTLRLCVFQHFVSPQFESN